MPDLETGAPIHGQAARGIRAPLRVPAGIPESRINQDALRVVSRLTRSGHEAYLVGGCVRDLLLGRRPKDFDIATGATPRQIRGLFRNARIIGRRFKLAHVVYGDHVLETATFRAAPPPPDEDADSPILREDNTFGTAAEDARRRDFTINGLFLDPLANQILDYVSGLDDLEARVLRTIGDPDVRMAEDPVRILRAIKFATRLGFRIDEPTWGAMGKHAGLLERAAPPRVLEEIMRLLCSGTALGAFRMLRACGALEVLMPAVAAHVGRADDPDPRVHERADGYWRLLEALDADVHAGRTPDRGLVLAVVYLRIVEREADARTRSLPGAPPDLFEVTGEVLEPVAMAARLPRRDAAVARRIIAQQPRFTEAPRPGSRAEAFVLAEDFPESLNLFRLRSAAWGQGWDLYQSWVDAAARVRELPAEDQERLQSRPRPRRRRRRRTGRAASGPGAGAGAGGDSQPARD